MTDTSPKYTKMSYKAWLYLKDLYTPQKGDIYKCSCENCRYNPNPNLIYMINDYDYDYVTGRKRERGIDPTYIDMMDKSGVGGFGAYWNEGKDSFFVLWSQRRLQEIARDRCPYPKAVTFLICISNVVIHPTNPPNNKGIANSENKYWGQFTSWEQLWLAFIFHEKFNRRWDDTKEDWVSNDES